MSMRQTVAVAILAPLCAVSLAQDKPAAPAATELQKLHFSSFHPSAPEISEHDRLRENAQVLASTEKGLELLRNYHEPVLTRGSLGVALFRSASPAVVLVMVGKVNQQGDFDIEGLGTGALIDSRGYVLTNWHVISGYNAAGIVTKPTNNDDPNTSEVLVGRVIARDLARDLALIRIDNPKHAFPTLPLGDLNEAEVAEDIHIIGHPKGELWSYSTGVISQVRAGYEWTYRDNSHHSARVLQLQTAINPGNSGGPVLNDAGHLIGLIAMSQEGQNLDYAVAIDEIKAFLTINLPARTRGSSGKAATAGASPNASLEFAKSNLPDGRTVTRASANGIVSYIIADKGDLSGLVLIGSSTVRTANGLGTYMLDGTSNLRGNANERGDFEITRK